MSETGGKADQDDDPVHVGCERRERDGGKPRKLVGDEEKVRPYDLLPARHPNNRRCPR